jgi:hypothetical protein
MINIRLLGANGFCLYSVFILFLTTLIDPAISHEVVLQINENYNMENCKLQIEDIDSQAERVWLLIQDGQEPSLSMVLGINDTLRCGKLTVLVKRIYAGESADLVRLAVNSTEHDLPGGGAQA